MHKWLWLSVAVAVLDQLSKVAATTQLVVYQPVAIAPQVNFTLVYNAGASFGILSSASGWQRWFFIALAVAVSVYLYRWLQQLAVDARVTAASIALIIGGAVGNAIDRVVLGHVVDFIDVYYGRYHWPTFNFADTAITLGVVMVVVTVLFERPRIA